MVHLSVSTFVFGYAYRTSASFTNGRAVMHVAKLIVPITSRPPTYLHANAVIAVSAEHVCKRSFSCCSCFQQSSPLSVATYFVPA